jgi:hypothetical protein
MRIFPSSRSITSLLAFVSEKAARPSRRQQIEKHAVCAVAALATLGHLASDGGDKTVSFRAPPLRSSNRPAQDAAANGKRIGHGATHTIMVNREMVNRNAPEFISGPTKLKSRLPGEKREASHLWFGLEQLPLTL